MAHVSIRNLQKAYETFTAVRGIDLEIKDKEFMVFVGPSGCGKSTTLRMIAGLEDITGGDLMIGERRVNDLSPGDRDIAMVFQNYALYPHMSVRDNIGFSLRQRRMPKAQIRTMVEETAKILSLEPLLDRKPRALSGGQRQRVAMGRAIVRRPQVFLFDEPLSNLDAKLRVQMRTEIKRLHQTIPTTTVYVTHDQVEAMTMADRVVVMNAGLVEQVGLPQELYSRPQTKFVAGFIGSPAMNFIDATLVRSGSGLAIKLGDGTTLSVPADRTSVYEAFVDRKVLFGIRPESLSGAAESNAAAIAATVQVVEPLGAETLIYFTAGGVDGCARLSPDVRVAVGEPIRLAPDMSRMHLIDPETDRVVLPN